MNTNPTASSLVHTNQSELNTDHHSTDPAVQISLNDVGRLFDLPQSSSTIEYKEIYSARK